MQSYILQSLIKEMSRAVYYLALGGQRIKSHAVLYLAVSY